MPRSGMLAFFFRFLRRFCPILVRLWHHLLCLLLCRLLLLLCLLPRPPCPLFQQIPRPPCPRASPPSRWRGFRSSSGTNGLTISRIRFSNFGTEKITEFANPKIRKSNFGTQKNIEFDERGSPKYQNLHPSVNRGVKGV